MKKLLLSLLVVMMVTLAVPTDTTGEQEPYQTPLKVLGW